MSAGGMFNGSQQFLRQRKNDVRQVVELVVTWHAFMCVNRNS